MFNKGYQSIPVEEDHQLPQEPVRRRRWGYALLLLQVVSVLAIFGVITYNQAQPSGTQKSNNAFLGDVSGSYYSSLSDEEKVALFEDFKANYHKKYEDDEEEKRYENFSKNLVRIDALNGEQTSATYGITQFADFTDEELRKIKGYKVEEDRAAFGATDAEAMDSFDTYNDGLYGFQDYSRELCGVEERFPEFCDYNDPNDLPDSFDWRDYGAVSDMRNQYICGDCWAFAITESIASQWFLYGNDLASVSAQEMTSCNQYCWGCNGGWFVGGFTKAMQQTWSTDEGYPFMSRNGVTQDCRADIVENGETNIHISGWTKVEADGIEMEMKLALVKNGPMVVAVDATSMEFYTSGLDPGIVCSTTSLDHAVTLVGWGRDADTDVPYWTVKNSWGDIWGEDGYWRVVFGRNSCGISEYAMMTI